MQWTKMSQDILNNYQVRKNKKQKALFRDLICKDLEKIGYDPKIESKRNLVKCHNIVVGDPEEAKVLVTAHYDTCAVLPFPNFITPRSLFWYLLYQLSLTVVILFLIVVITTIALLALPNHIWIGSWISLICTMFAIWLLLFGKANKHTVNDNTSGVITILETAHQIPNEMRDKVCFVFFDNEELGMLGSGAFASTHKNVSKGTLVLNCDCVSDGDSLQLFPSKAVKKNEQMSQLIEDALKESGDKETEYVRTFGFYPSDNLSFKYGVGICGLKKGFVGYYMDRIHTGKDIIFKEENLEQIICFLKKVIEEI